tara:strand:- start:5191 stop:5535 length:345 start_codon:yes stop_codon:yes gene_type:complete
MNKRKLIVFLFLASFLTSCGGVQDALEGKKRSENSDEFLVEKKNPLTLPPDIDELPVPLDKEKQSEEEIVNESAEEINNLKKVLQISEDEETNLEEGSNDTNSLENKIIEKINN